MIRLFRRRPSLPPVSNVRDFLVSLLAIAPDVGMGCYGFPDTDGTARGWVQFCNMSDRDVTLHRLWTLKPGGKHGSFMLSTLCELADRHGVEIKLQALPIGRKPHPLSRDELVEWYRRYGFEGTHRKMSRKPRSST